ncbi:MAG: ABC transporter ATP-binding protein [Lachnospiraceae bacterium]
MAVILEVKDLYVDFHFKKRVHPIVKGVSFQVERGKCLGILGESGSGKSMTAKAIMGLLDKSFSVRGQALYQGQDLIASDGEALRQIRGKEICMILQNPMTCFDPLYRIGAQMEETFAEHTRMSKEEINNKSIQVLQTMQIRNPEEVLQKYPHQLSGGMLQRIMIGLAMALEPDILIADEPTTAIDAITQYEIMKEFARIKESGRTAMIFITHDLSVISNISDQVLVMNQGLIADMGTFQEIMDHARDPYTVLLVEKKKAVMEKYRAALQKGGNQNDRSQPDQCEFS